MAMQASTAQADVTLRSGVSGSAELRPFAAYKLKHDWALAAWRFELELEGRIQRDAGIGDANNAAEFHAERELSGPTKLEFDLLHEFEREKDDSIEQSHAVGADVGLEHRFEAITAKADFGILGRIYHDTTQAGFTALDRRDENFLESELALRLTANTHSTWQPFLESAWLRRDYQVNTKRDFAGPDLILGLSSESGSFRGDAGVLFAARRAEGLATSFVIGPYVDLKWTVNSTTDLALDLSSGLDQDTSGDAKPFAFYEATATASHSLTDHLKLSALVEASLENRRTGDEIEITPTLKLDWTTGIGIDVFASAGFTYSKIEGSPSELAPSLEAGLKWNLK